MRMRLDQFAIMPIWSVIFKNALSIHFLSKEYKKSGIWRFGSPTSRKEAGAGALTPEPATFWGC